MFNPKLLKIKCFFQELVIGGDWLSLHIVRPEKTIHRIILLITKRFYLMFGNRLVVQRILWCKTGVAGTASGQMAQHRDAADAGGSDTKWLQRVQHTTTTYNKLEQM